jgi:hypothetical protein
MRAKAALEMLEQNVQSTGGALTTGTTSVVFALAITTKEDAVAVADRLAEALTQIYPPSVSENLRPNPPSNDVPES